MGYYHPLWVSNCQTKRLYLSFLSARLFRWIGSQVSGLLSDQADISYQKP